MHPLPKKILDPPLSSTLPLSQCVKYYECLHFQISHVNFIVSAEKWLISKLLAGKTSKNRPHSELLLQLAELSMSVFPKNLLKLVEQFSSHHLVKKAKLLKRFIASRVQTKPRGPFILVRESETNDFQSNCQVQIAGKCANLAVV